MFGKQWVTQKQWDVKDFDQTGLARFPPFYHT